jgi:FecR-like protein
MAILPPPPAPVVPAPPAKKRGCAGCGVGCLGCLGVFVVAVLLAVGGTWYFLVAQVQASVPASAALVVFSAPVEVGRNDSGYRTAVPGEPLSAGSSVRTGHGGHAAIQFPDGSFIRLASDTTVTVSAAQLNKDGTLLSAGITQKVGRTLSNVQHLISGANFKVGGHSVSAEVRGTEFEVLVRPNGTNKIWVFIGTVTVRGKTSATLTAGQEIDVDANGNLTNQRSNQFETQDPFPLEAQCAGATSTGANNAGTSQTGTVDTIATGQTSEQDYHSPGGNLTVAFCYPGSLMSVTVTDPAGGQHTAQGKSPVMLKIANGPPGLYKAVVRGVDVPAGGEPYALSFATDAACVEGNIDTGGVVRETLSNAQIAQALSQSGASGVTLRVQGTSPHSARIFYSSDLGGTPITWTIDFFAATPNLGVVLTEVTIRGVSITTQIVSRLPQAAGQAGVSIDFTVDRVYSCNGPSGGMMVIEGHR